MNKGFVFNQTTLILFNIVLYFEHLNMLRDEPDFFIC